MAAAPILKHVYREHIEHFGEPDEGITYDEASATKPTPAHFPQRIDVLIWHADDEVDMTTFATIGMSSMPMNGTEHRTELHFAVSTSLTPAEVQQCAGFLANIATYPFHYNTFIDWWHKLNDPGAIPLFKNATSILFHPRFVDDGWDRIEYDGSDIHLLNIIPISSDACLLRSRDELWQYVWEELVDPFTPW